MLARGDMEAAYAGVESLDRFASQGEIEDYRSMVLDKSQHQADFIKAHYSERFSVIEACCGNGRLLVALSPHIRFGKGFDIAESRVRFAHSWVTQLGLDQIDVWCDNLIEPSEMLDGVNADLAICITGAFNYFGALDGNAESRALSVLADLSGSDGGLILELYQHPTVLAQCAIEPGGIHRRWGRLPDWDPYRFSLSEFQFDQDMRVLTHEKTFIGRDGSVDEGRREALRIYSPVEIETLLADRYDSIEFFAGWTGEPYQDGAAQMLVWARK